MALGDSQMHRRPHHDAAVGAEHNLLDEAPASTAGLGLLKPRTVDRASLPSPAGSVVSIAQTEGPHWSEADVHSAFSRETSLDGSTENHATQGQQSPRLETYPSKIGARNTRTQLHRTPLLDMTNSLIDSGSTTIPNGPAAGDRRYVRQERKQEKLRALRLQTLMTRALVAEKRSELGEVRLAASAADEKFMKCVREKRNQAFPGDMAAVLEEPYQELQAIRDRYGALEDEYNTLEDRLDREEYEMWQLEESLARQDGDSSSESGGTDDLDVDTESHHPLEDEFLSRLGDVDLCREAHDELVVEHERLLGAMEQRARVGKRLAPDDEAALADFPAREAQILEELAAAERDAKRLRAACIEQGLLTDWDWDDEGDIALQSPNGTVDMAQAEYHRYPLLLQKPHDDEKTFQELISDFADPGDRITRWLLHKLKSSCSEVELCARVSDDVAGQHDQHDTADWQEAVLRHWFHDAAVLPPAAFAPNRTATTTATNATRAAAGSSRRMASGLLWGVAAGGAARSV